MAELWYERFVHHSFPKAMKSKAVKLTGYQMGKAKTDLGKGEAGMTHPAGNYRKRGFSGRKHHPIP